MNTKAQDTVHAKYYKQKIESSNNRRFKQEAIEQLREQLEYCNRVQSAETVKELTEVMIQEMLWHNSQARHRQFIIEYDMI